MEGTPIAISELKFIFQYDIITENTKRESKDIVTNVREENERQEGNKKLHYQPLGRLVFIELPNAPGVGCLRSLPPLGNLPPRKKLKFSKAEEDADTPGQGVSEIASRSCAPSILPEPQPMTTPASSSKVSTGPRFPKGQFPLAPKTEVTQLRDQVVRLTREVTDLRLLRDSADSKIKALTIFGAYQDHGLLLLSNKLPTLKVTEPRNYGLRESLSFVDLFFSHPNSFYTSTKTIRTITIFTTEEPTDITYCGPFREMFGMLYIALICTKAEKTTKSTPRTGYIIDAIEIGNIHNITITHLIITPDLHKKIP